MAPTYSKDTLVPKWFLSGSRVPQYSVPNLQTYLRNLLIYYPKKPEALRIITMEFFSELKDFSGSAQLLKKLYRDLLHRYKKDHLRQMRFDLSSENLSFLGQSNRLEQLVCHSISWKKNPKQVDCVSKIIKHSKQLRKIELNVNLRNSILLLKNLKYVPCLRSIYIKGITSKDLLKHKRIFLASKFTLETITLDQIFGCNCTIPFLRMILELPRLKTLKVYYGLKDGLDINKIPFNILSKRNISYAICALHLPKEFTFSIPNELGLADLEYLGICSKKLSFDQTSGWDIYEEEVVRSQKKSRRSLFLDMSGVTQQFMTCKNITTLSINFSQQGSTPKISFLGLKYLFNIRHLFVEVSYLSKNSARSLGIFQNLISFAQNLVTVNLHIHGRYLYKEKAHIKNFFRACAETLIEISLKFTPQPGCELRGLEIVYEGLCWLRRIESIKIFYTPITWNSIDIDNKNYFLNKQFLKEFCLLAPLLDSNKVPINYMKLNGITKLALSFHSLDMESKLIQKSTSFPNLKNLELSVIKIDMMLWNKVVKMISRLEQLQTLLLQLGLKDLGGEKLEQKEYEKAALDSLRTLFVNHGALMFLAFGLRVEPVNIEIFKKKSSNVSIPNIDLNSFFGRYFNRLPLITVSKVTLF